MIDFTKTEDTLYLNYTAEGRNIDENWITARLEENCYPFKENFFI
jgi:hypothetical protein